MGHFANLLRPRRRYLAEAAFCFGAAIAGAFVWVNGPPLNLTLYDDPVNVLYAALPIGLFFGARQALLAFGSPGVVIRPQGLQIGRRIMLPWTAVRAVRVKDQQSKRDDHVGVIEIELDRETAKAAGVKSTVHPIDVRQHETSVAWVLTALHENVADAGVEIPGSEKLI
ncbi:hypothetical protein [Gymnodinialimonas hymeniacidonis]|uniref:hypothetical protein n=1 Tax=Gymnodinialimonas hymeniacidonis TaxID=3126508 RepID=UPI0034C5B868